MSEELTPRQQILMWELISRDGTAMLKDLKLDSGPKERQKLQHEKYISINKEKHNAQRLTLQERGWDYLASNHPNISSTTGGSKYDRAILQFVLHRIQHYAVAESISFAGIFGSKTEAANSKVDDKIVDAFNFLAGTPARDSLSLTRLRAHLSYIDRSYLDAALRRMWQSKRVQLIALDNPRDIAAEREAAITIKDDAFHKLWIEP